MTDGEVLNELRSLERETTNQLTVMCDKPATARAISFLFAATSRCIATDDYEMLKNALTAIDGDLLTVAVLVNLSACRLMITNMERKIAAN